jgi:hypothetical protein
MSVMNAPATHRQCPRCRKVQPARALVCDGCGRRFQVPPPEPLSVAPSGVYAGRPASSLPTGDTWPGGGRGISGWWGPAATALLVTPLGWVLLPLALLLCVIMAALSLTVLPTLLAAIAAARVRTSRLPIWQKSLTIPFTLLTGLCLNALLWCVFHHIAFTLSPPP